MQNALVSTLIGGNAAGCGRDTSSQPMPGEVPFEEILAEEEAASGDSVVPVSKNKRQPLAGNAFVSNQVPVQRPVGHDTRLKEQFPRATAEGAGMDLSPDAISVQSTPGARSLSDPSLENGAEPASGNVSTTSERPIVESASASPLGSRSDRAVTSETEPSAGEAERDLVVESWPNPQATDAQRLQSRSQAGTERGSLVGQSERNRNDALSPNTAAETVGASSQIVGTKPPADPSTGVTSSEAILPGFDGNSMTSAVNSSSRQVQKPTGKPHILGGPAPAESVGIAASMTPPSWSNSNPGQVADSTGSIGEGPTTASSLDGEEGLQTLVGQGRGVNRGEVPTESGPRTAYESNPVLGSAIAREVGLPSEAPQGRSAATASSKLDGVSNHAAGNAQRWNDVELPGGDKTIVRTASNSPQPKADDATIFEKSKELFQKADGPVLTSATIGQIARSEKGESPAALRSELEGGSNSGIAPSSTGTDVKSAQSLMSDWKGERFPADTVQERTGWGDMVKPDTERKTGISSGNLEIVQSGSNRSSMPTGSAVESAFSHGTSSGKVLKSSKTASVGPNSPAQVTKVEQSAIGQGFNGHAGAMNRTEPGVSNRQMTGSRGERSNEPRGGESIQSHAGVLTVPSKVLPAVSQTQALQQLELSSGFSVPLDGEDALNGSEERMIEPIETRTDASFERTLASTSGPAERSASVAQMRSNARYAATALAERAAVSSAGNLEVRMSPEELGALRISFSQGDAGLTVVIQADRPETLDLFRRNIEQFSEDLKALGYEDVSMSFEGGHESGGDAGHEDGHGRTEYSHAGTLPERHREDVDTPVQGRSGLDLRL